MNPLLQSPWIAAFAAAGSIAALAALHFLRSKPVKRRVVSTLFWKAAVIHQKPTTLWGRLSRGGTFLLLSLLLLCIAGGLAGMKWSWLSQDVNVVILDVGSTMGTRDADGRVRFDKALELAASDLAGLPRGRAVLIEAGAEARVVSDTISSVAELRHAASWLGPTTKPSLVERAIVLAENKLPPGAGGRVLYYGDAAPQPDPRRPGVAERLTVRHVGSGGSVSPGDAGVERGVGLVGVVFSPGELIAQVAWGGERGGPYRVRAESNGVALGEVLVDERTGVARLMTSVSGGAVVKLSLWPAETGTAALDEAVVTIPVEGRVSFKVEGELPDALAALMRVMGGGGGSEGVMVRVIGSDRRDSSRGEEADGASPAIRVVWGGEERAALDTVRASGLVRTNPASRMTADLDMEGAVAGAGGLNIEGGEALLVSEGRVLAAMTRKGGRRELLLSDALFSEASNVTARPAFFVLMRRAVLSLSGLSAETVSLSLRRTLADPVWSQGRAYQARASDRESLARVAAVGHESVPGAVNSVGISVEPWQVFLLAALGLLLLEGVLFATRRIA